MNLFDHEYDEERQQLLAAGWQRHDRFTHDGPNLEEWKDPEGNLWSLRSAIAELGRRIAAASRLPES